jgi:hypothetical protein
MRRLVAPALGLAALALVAAFWLAIAQQETAAVPAAPVARVAGSAHSTIKDLMDSIIDPSADALWGAVGTVVDKDEGTTERFPKTQEEWTDVRRAAVRIIEGANLLLMPGRETAPPGIKSETPGVELEPAEMTVLISGNRTGFDAFAAELRNLGWEALRASEARNAASLMDIGGRMQEVCEGCHQTFWYPDAGAPQ